MPTNESFRWAGKLKASARLKLNASRRAIRSSQWVKRELGLSAVGQVPHDTGNLFAMPASMGRARPYFSDLNSPEAIASGEVIDREREEYERNCDDYDALMAQIELPAEPVRETLAPELQACEAAIAEGRLDQDIVIKTRDDLLDLDLTLRDRIATTVDVEFLRAIVAAVNRAIAEFTGLPQRGILPQLDNPAMFIRGHNCR